ncbi:unnamed protein product [Allacma fusca]|uniref:Uncharacterized protein n=1 Tax=Allacma fusca TaxID=39272 RepID=A0A8J2Q5F1_9HEXA|nr:unnamed protein product [Allacma fusca]
MSTTRFWFAVLSVFTFEIAQASPKGYLSGGIESNFIREEVRTWKSPDHLRKNYPYYLSGYDEEEKPIWVLELGKWDVQRIALNGNKTIPDFSNYVDKAIFNILQSLDLNSTEPTAVTKIEGIIDMDGFAYSQLASIPTCVHSNGGLDGENSESPRSHHVQIRQPCLHNKHKFLRDENFGVTPPNSGTHHGASGDLWD